MASATRGCHWLRRLSATQVQRPMVRGSSTGPLLQRIQRFSNVKDPEPPVGPVYELRIYSIKPHKFATFQQIMTQQFHLRLAHSKPLGYWIADLGGIFQAVHIWPYDSVSHRAQIRQALASDPQWNGDFVAHFLPCTRKMENALTVLSPGCAELSTDFQPSPTAAYELLSLPLQSGGDGAANKVSAGAKPGSSTATLVGSFRNVFGDVNMEHHLIRYPDADTAFVHARRRAEKNPTMPGYSRFMVPHACSPIK